MSRLTFTSCLKVTDENSLTPRFRGKEDGTGAKQLGVKKKALADVGNTLNQNATERVTPKKSGIQPLKKEKQQLKVYDEKFDKKKNVISPSKNTKLFGLTPKKLNIKQKLGMSPRLGKDSVKQINEKLSAEANVKPKLVETAVTVLVNEEDEEVVEDFGCSHCLQPFEDDDYDDILPKYMRLTAEQIIDSAMCWEPKPKVTQKKVLNMPLLPEPEIYEPEDDIFELESISLMV